MHVTSQRGFTLIEVMIVVVIIGILAAIAYPSYQEQIRKGNRAEAKAALMTAAQQLERCFTQFSAYDDDGCTIPTSSENNRYSLDTPTLTATTFTLRAQPTASVNDPDCAVITITQTGARASRTSADADSTSTCW